jgi:hypothetical protein
MYSRAGMFLLSLLLAPGACPADPAPEGSSGGAGICVCNLRLNWALEYTGDAESPTRGVSAALFRQGWVPGDTIKAPPYGGQITY